MYEWHRLLEKQSIPAGGGAPGRGGWGWVQAALLSCIVIRILRLIVRRVHAEQCKAAFMGVLDGYSQGQAGNLLTKYKTAWTDYADIWGRSPFHTALSD